MNFTTISEKRFATDQNVIRHFSVIFIQAKMRLFKMSITKVYSALQCVDFLALKIHKSLLDCTQILFFVLLHSNE